MHYQLLLLITALLGTTLGDADGREKCEGPVINNVHYNREVIRKMEYVDALSYDRSTNTLYLCYLSPETVAESLAASINLDNKEYIEGGRNCQGVFATPSAVYMNNHENIFKYDKVSNKTDLYATHPNRSYVDSLFIKDTIYFIDTFVYKIDNGDISRLEDIPETTANGFVIDENDYVYLNKTGLYVQKKDKKDSVRRMEMETKAVKELNGLSVNSIGDVYAYGLNGIFVVNKNTNSVDKLVEHDVYSLTFDHNDNVIYSDYNEIIRLTPSSDQDCVGNTH